MKKVGIITYARVYNYGTALQAYALQQAVSSLPDVEGELIDFRFHEWTKFSRWWYFKMRCRRLLYYFTATKKVYRKMKYKKELEAKRPAFDQFFTNDFKTSAETYFVSDDLLKSPPLYDVYMTGSDQTWSPLIGLKPVLFLHFAPKNARKVSYAPSVGVTSFNEEQHRFFEKWLSDFHCVSCREEAGAKALSTCYQGKVPTVLDPTLLLNNDQWSEIAVKPDIEGDYILCYLIGDRPYYREYVRKLSKKMNCPAYYIPVSWRDVGEGNNLLPEAGPREFLGLIKHAKCVCTDSFHGSIFSINFNTNFYTFLKHAGGESASDNSRIVGILKKFGLESRLLSPQSAVAFEEIDYAPVNARLEALRAASWQYLKEAVGV